MLRLVALGALGISVAHAEAPAGPRDKTLVAPVLVVLKTPEDHWRLAQDALREKRNAVAIAELRSALGLAPSRLEYRRKLAELLFQEKRYSEAIIEYDAILAVKPEPADYDKVVFLLRQSGAARDALRYALKGGERYPSEPRFVFLSVELALENNELALARKLSDRLPKNEEGMLLWARLVEKQGLWGEAYRTYRQLSATHPERAKGTSRALAHAVRVGRYLVFAPEPWRPVTTGFANPEAGASLQVEILTSQGDPVEAAQKLAKEKVPPLLRSGFATEIQAALAEKIRDHEAGGEGHYKEANKEERDHVSELVTQVPVRIEQKATPEGHGFVIIRETGSAVGLMQLPIYIWVPPGGTVAYLLSGKMGADKAESMLRALSQAGVVEER